MPLVSCIITTYNRPDMVAGAVDSILSQTFNDLEVIVIDDCSPTSYEEVVTRYQSQIRYHRLAQNSGGCSTGRNTGVAMASGKYVAFLDDADRWFPSKIEKQVRLMESNPGYVACSTGYVESVSGKTVSLGLERIYQPMLYLRNLSGPPSTLLVKKEIAEKYPFDETLIHAEDWDAYLGFSSLGTIGYLKEPLIQYNTDDHIRMCNQFAKLDVAQIERKARAVEKNRMVIGEKNYRLRIAMYYLAGIKNRKKRFEQIGITIKRVGLGSTVNYLYHKLFRKI